MHTSTSNFARAISRCARAARINLSAITLIAWGLLGSANADQLSIPTNLTGGAALETLVPVNAAITSSGFISAQFSIAYNAAVLTATETEAGALAAGKNCATEVNTSTPGTAVVSIFCSGTITGNGELLRIVFSVIGAVGTSSPLTFVANSCVLNEGSPPCTTANGSLSVVQSRTIGGKVIYYNGLATRPPLAQERPVKDVTVNLSGGFTSSIDTLPDGTYSIGALQGQLNVQPRKRGGHNGAITSFDAALVAQHLVGLITLNARQLIAADANGTGAVVTNDASQIARFAIGSITELKMEADCNSAFAFVPAATVVANQTLQQPNTNVLPPPAGSGCVYGEIRYNPLNVNAAGQDFIAILMGDVSGNWLPPAGALAALQNAATPAARQSTAKVHLGKKQAKPGSIITLPISVATAKGAIGIDIVLQYDPAVLLPIEDIEKTRLSQHMTLGQNYAEERLIRISLFGAQGLDKNGAILRVPFLVVGEERTISPVEIVEALVDEKPTLTSNGQVRVQ